MRNKQVWLRPDGQHSEDYESANWPLRRIAWEFLRRNRSYKEDCDSCAAMRVNKNSYSISKGAEWRLAKLVPYQYDWERAKREIHFSLHGPNYIESDGQRKIDILNPKGTAYFRVNLEAALKDQKILTLQIKNIEKKSAELLRQLRRTSVRNPRVKLKYLGVYGKYLRVLDLFEAGESAADVWKALNSKTTEKNKREPRPGQIVPIKKLREQALRLVDKRYVKFVVADLLKYGRASDL